MLDASTYVRHHTPEQVEKLASLSVGGLSVPTRSWPPSSPGPQGSP